MDPIMKAIVDKLPEAEKEKYEVMVRGRWRSLVNVPNGAIPTEIRLANRPDKAGQRVAIVQLERLGDILSILPLAYRLWQEGCIVDWYGRPEFTWVLKHCSYINRICDVTAGVSATLRELESTVGEGYDRVICPQVDQNPVPVDRCTNFIRQQWLRGGRPEGLDQGWPLVFDRDAGVGRWGKLPDRPVMLVNLEGRSSKLSDEQKHDLQQWLGNTFGSRFVIEYWPTPASDSSVKPTLTSLLNLLVLVNLTGGVLISIDSAPIHLAAATSTPTIVLSRGGWDGSERRPHWIGEAITYADVFSEVKDSNGIAAGHFQIKKRLGCYGQLARVFHVVDWWLPSKLGDEYDRIVAARRTWGERVLGPVMVMRWEVVPFCGLGRRSAADLPVGIDGRREKPVPYIKDIIEFGVQQAKLRSGSDQSWVVFTNSDVHLCSDAEQVLAIHGHDGCCFSRRKDFASLSGVEVPYRSGDPKFRRVTDHVGADLFAVQVWWWEKHRDEVPDLLMSFEGWDYCVRHLFWRYNKNAQLPTCCYHQMHESYWSQPENLLDTPGQVWNRRVGGDWARAMGLPVSDSGVQLFDPDPPMEKL